MRLNDLRVGNGIEVFITRDEFRYRLTSRVEGTEEGKVYISLISSGSRVFAFKEGDDVELLYRDRDRMWKWFGVKPGIATLDGTKVHCFSSDKIGMSYNRRDAYRVQIMKALEITRYTPIEDHVSMDDLDMDASAEKLMEQGIEKSPVNVVVKDISETGAGFYSPFALRVDDRVRIVLPTEYGNLVCDGVILRVVEEIWDRYHLFYGCNFLRTDKSLSRYIFAEQRLMLSVMHGEP